MKEYSITIDGQTYEVAVLNAADGLAQVTVDGEEFSVSYTEKKKEEEAAVAAPIETASAAKAPSGSMSIVSPLPGVLVEVCVAKGQSVKTGQKVAVIEAMKMENEILSECDGTVTQVHAAKGDSLLEGAKIITIE